MLVTECTWKETSAPSSVTDHLCNVGEVSGPQFSKCKVRELEQMGSYSLITMGSVEEAWMVEGRKKVSRGKKTCLSLGWNCCGRAGSRVQISARFPRFPVMGTLLLRLCHRSQKTLSFEEPLIPKVTVWERCNVHQLSGPQQSTGGPIPTQIPSLK